MYLYAVSSASGQMVWFGGLQAGSLQVSFCAQILFHIQTGEPLFLSVLSFLPLAWWLCWKACIFLLHLTVAMEEQFQNLLRKPSQEANELAVLPLNPKSWLRMCFCKKRHKIYVCCQFVVVVHHWHLLALYCRKLHPNCPPKCRIFVP